MGFTLDPEWGAAAEPLLAAFADAPPVPPGDWATRRALMEALMAQLSESAPPTPDVVVTGYTTTAADGSTIELRWFAKRDHSPGSAVVYLHGGGMILGTVDLYAASISRYVDQSGVPFLAVDYRRAPEHPHPTPVEDGYAGLVWLAEHATELGVDPARIAVMGDSAGGGLAAGVALLARDRGGPALARQILVYPMLDDRTEPDDALTPFLTWTWDDNVTGWQALLGDAYRTDAASPYAAPARATDLAGLAPAYIDVGELDAFRNEDVDYARRLTAAGVSTELHLHPGVPHAFEAFVPDTSVAQRTMADRLRVLASL